MAVLQGLSTGFMGTKLEAHHVIALSHDHSCAVPKLSLFHIGVEWTGGAGPLQAMLHSQQCQGLFHILRSKIVYLLQTCQGCCSFL